MNIHPYDPIKSIDNFFKVDETTRSQVFVIQASHKDMDGNFGPWQSFGNEWKYDSEGLAQARGRLAEMQGWELESSRFRIALITETGVVDG